MLKPKEVLFLSFRYLFLLIIAFPSLYLFYLVFTPLTIYPVYKILSLIYGASLAANVITLGSLRIVLIPACIAGAAYYLLFIFNFTVPMPLKKRVKSLLFIVISFLILNIIRIVVLSVLAVNKYSNFDQIHIFIWYFGSTFLVLLIWFFNVYLFKIKEIPFFTDLRNLLLLTKIKEKSRRKLRKL